MCLGGSKRTAKEDNVKIIKVEEWYEELKERDREDIIEKIEKIRLDVKELDSKARE